MRLQKQARQHRTRLRSRNSSIEDEIGVASAYSRVKKVRFVLVGVPQTKQQDNKMASVHTFSKTLPTTVSSSSAFTPSSDLAHLQPTKSCPPSSMLYYAAVYRKHEAVLEATGTFQTTKTMIIDTDDSVRLYLMVFFLFFRNRSAEQTPENSQPRSNSANERILSSCVPYHPGRR